MTARFTVPDNPVALRMENDLLAFEVDHLRGRLNSGQVTDVARELEQLRAELARARRHLATERERVSELTRARSDLRWLLGRLSGSPAGPLLRRFSGFRTLLERWQEQ